MLEAISAVTGAVGLANEFAKLFLVDSESDSKKNELKRQKKNLLRSYHLELLENNSILNSINIQSGIAENQLQAAKTLAPLLHNEYGKVIAIGFSDYKETLEAVKNQDYEISKDFPNKVDNFSMQESIVFTVSRIDFIKNISLLSDENSKFFKKDFFLLKRLKNIKSATFNLLKEFNHSLDEILDECFV